MTMRAALLMALLYPGFVVAQNAPPLAVSAARKPGTIRVELIGDSTQTDNAGYGRGFCANLAPDIECLNFARGGQSTKSFRVDGIWDKALESKPDYMLIQFGHNDETTGLPVGNQSTVAQFQDNLRKFVMEARAQNITAVLVTPLTRRMWGKDEKIHSDLTAYANGMAAVAEELQVPLIDLQARSIAYLDSVGKEQGNKLAITKKDKMGKVQLDGTHLNWAGSYIFGRMVAEELGKAVPSLAQYVKPVPAILPAEGVLAMRVIEGGPFKIVMAGDSAIAAAGGWGPRFGATLMPNVSFVDMGVAGTAKSYVDSGAWRKALGAGGQYYFIEFGNDAAGHEPAPAVKKELEQMVHDVRAAEAIPILVSPFWVGREDGLSVYADAARDVATEDRVTFVDLYQMSRQYFSSHTAAQADAAPVLARMVADNVIRTEVELGPNVIGVPEGTGPSLPKQASPTDGH